MSGQITFDADEMAWCSAKLRVIANAVNALPTTGADVSSDDVYGFWLLIRDIADWLYSEGKEVDECPK